MDINRNAMSYFNNPIQVNITQDLQAYNYLVEFTYECSSEVNISLTLADFEVTIRHYNGTYLVPENMTCQNNDTRFNKFNCTVWLETINR